MKKPSIDLTRANDLLYVQAINRQVADHLFPDRTFTSMALKTYEEIGEMVANPMSAEEVADVMIMLMDHMDRIEGHVGGEILLKLQKNLDRHWGTSVTGVYKHLQPGDPRPDVPDPSSKWPFITSEEC